MSTQRVSGPGAWARPAGAAASAAPAVVVLGPRTRLVRIALAGCGVVGGSLVRLLQERGDEIAGARGVRLQLARILVRDPARPRGLDLPAGQPVTLKPGGIHVMLLGLTQPLKTGQSFPLTLHFAKTGTQVVIVKVEKVGAMGPQMGGGGGHAGQMQMPAHH